MIENVDFLEILDGQGSPTLLAILVLENGQVIKATAPCVSAMAKYDNTSTRYQGKGVRHMINAFKPLFQKALHGKSLKEVDPILIELKSMGTNFTGALSIACIKAEAALNQKTIYSYLSDDIKMPQLIVNLTQHYMIVPVNPKPINEHIRMVHDVLYVLEDILLEKHMSLYDPHISYKEKIEIILQAIEEAGFCLGRDVGLFLNLEGLFQQQDERYFFDSDVLEKEEYAEQLVEGLKTYPIVGYENAFDRNDHQGWQYFTNLISERIKRQVIVAGSHNPKDANVFTTIPAFEGTITETLENLANRGREALVTQSLNVTADTFVVDFALGLQAPFVKFGNIKQRDAYNRLLEIEHEIF